MISDFRVSNFFKHFPAAGYIDTMLFVFVWFKISFYFKTFLTKCTRWFDLSSFGSVNTLVAIGNERERFRWNQQHTLELTAEETAKTGKPNNLMSKKNDFRKVQRYEAL